jgi:hypothetical protein
MMVVAGGEVLATSGEVLADRDLEDLQVVRGAEGRRIRDEVALVDRLSAVVNDYTVSRVGVALLGGSWWRAVWMRLRPLFLAA